MRTQQERRRWVSIVAATVLVLAGLVGWGVYASQQADGHTAPRAVSEDAAGLVLGTGPVTVDVYVDFMCPHCATFEQTAGPTLTRLVDEGRIKLVYHPIALLDRASSTRYSTRAAAAAGCAADAGKLPEYVQVLFSHQPPEGGAGLSDNEIVRLAGADAACVRDEHYVNWVRHVTDRAAARGVTGTPTVLVNGRQVAPTVAALTRAIGP